MNDRSRRTKCVVQVIKSDPFSFSGSGKTEGYDPVINSSSHQRYYKGLIKVIYDIVNVLYGSSYLSLSKETKVIFVMVVVLAWSIGKSNVQDHINKIWWVLQHTLWLSLIIHACLAELELNDMWQRAEWCDLLSWQFGVSNKQGLICRRFRHGSLRK